MSNEPNTSEEKKGTPPLAGLEGLLSNPALMRTIGSMLGASAQTATDPQKQSNDAAHVSADGISAVLSDPAMLEKLPQMIAVIKPMLEYAVPQQTPEKPSNTSPDACRDQLLLSLKPFLSPSRCEAVDTILRIAKLGTVFQQFK